MEVIDIPEIKDTSINGSKMYENIGKQRQKEKALVPLRISDRCVILVTPDKCNEEYAAEYRRRVLRQFA